MAVTNNSTTKTSSSQSNSSSGGAFEATFTKYDGHKHGRGHRLHKECTHDDTVIIHGNWGQYKRCTECGFEATKGQMKKRQLEQES